MISKGRVDKAVEKYMQFVQVLKEYGLTMESLYMDKSTLQGALGERLDMSYRVSEPHTTAHLLLPHRID